MPSIRIKHALSHKNMPVSGTRASHYIQAAGYSHLPVTALHAAAVEDLPLIHKDPFDRMLVAQAHAEPLHLLTHDRQLQPYGEMVLLV